MTVYLHIAHKAKDTISVGMSWPDTQTLDGLCNCRGSGSWTSSTIVLDSIDPDYEARATRFLQDMGTSSSDDCSHTL